MVNVRHKIREKLLDNEKTSKKRRIILIFSFSIMTIVLAAFLGIYTAINLSTLSLIDTLLTIMPQSALENRTNILIIGVDNTKGRKRTDTIMVAHLDRNNKRVGILSIPRDTRIYIPDHGYTKINHAYAYGGVELVKSVVSEFLQIPIDSHIAINVGGVANIIDELGGINIDVDKRMYYIDKAGDLYIDLKPGNQVLSGEQAIGYVRFRKDPQGDIGRIRRQQNFMQAVAKKVIDSGNFFKVPALFKKITDNLVTNMNTRQIFTLALEMRGAFMLNNISINTIPGAVVLLEGVSYWRADIPSALNLIDKVIHGFERVEAPDTRVDSTKAKRLAKKFDKKETKTVAKKAIIKNKNEKNKLGEPRTLNNREINKISKTLHNTPKDQILPEQMHLSVEILNGAGVPLIAQRTAKVLKDKKIKVPWVGNAGHFNYPNTVIVDWKGLTKEVMQLANSLGVDPKHIVTYYKPNKKLDVTLVLGHDWPQILEKAESQ